MKLKLKLPPFDVDPDNPFGNDRLKVRGEEIVNLTRLVKANSSPLVIAVNSPWGMGKTTFIRMWEAHLNKEEQERVLALCFNAWETDFAVDPFVPFLAKMENNIPTHQEKWDAVKKLGIEILPHLVGVGFGGVAGAIAQKTADALATDAVHSCKNQIEVVAKFKAALREYTKTSGQRVVIFVDELDRCRPDYAIKVLERIKHLFEVEGVTFILALDRGQLGNSVRGLYGDRLDADTYLRRFIDLDYTMNEPDMGVYWDVLLNDLGANDYLKKYQHAPESMRKSLLLLQQIYNFSLRDAEQIMLRINLVLSIGEFYPEFLAFLVAIREKAPEEFASYVAEGGSPDGMVKYWEGQIADANVFATDSTMYLAARITACIIVTKCGHNSNALTDYHHNYEKSANSQNTPEPEGQYAYYQLVAEQIEQYADRWDAIDTLRLFIPKIKLLDQFRF